VAYLLPQDLSQLRRDTVPYLTPQHSTHCSIIRQQRDCLLQRLGLINPPPTRHVICPTCASSQQPRGMKTSRDAPEWPQIRRIRPIRFQNCSFFLRPRVVVDDVASIGTVLHSHSLPSGLHRSPDQQPKWLSRILPQSTHPHLLVLADQELHSVSKRAVIRGRRDARLQPHDRVDSRQVKGLRPGETLSFHSSRLHTHSQKAISNASYSARGISQNSPTACATCGW
jgi:hypothetical protein